MPTGEEVKENIYDALLKLYEQKQKPYRAKAIRRMMTEMGLPTIGPSRIGQHLSTMTGVKKMGHDGEVGRGYVPILGQ